MSEGGTEGMEAMFIDHPLTPGTFALEIGYGLGAMAFYLADRYAIHITGVEVTQTLKDEATRRIPEHLKNQINFLTYQSPHIPIDDQTFDIIYSKGVFPHIKDRAPLLKECFRVLKPGGFMIIDDWLSRIPDQWCPRIQDMCDREGLILYPETEHDYLNKLKQAGFSNIHFIDVNEDYARYNWTIIDHLNQPKMTEKAESQFNKHDHDMALLGYTLIAEAIERNELLIRRVIAHHL